jgi:hypothetical protein
MSKIKVHLAWLNRRKVDNIVLSDQAIEQVKESLRDGAPLRERRNGQEIGICRMVGDAIFADVRQEYQYLIAPELTAPALVIFVTDDQFTLADGVRIVDNIISVDSVFIKRRDDDGSHFEYVPD